MAPCLFLLKGLRWTLSGGVAIALGLAGPAGAQSMSTNSSQYNAGYGHTSGQENQPVNVSMRDANGNLVVADGTLLSPSGGSVFSNSSGAGSTVTGVGAGATAVGNSLTVVTTGNYNTVIVNSTQTNTGNITATTSITGGVGNAQ